MKTKIKVKISVFSPSRTARIKPYMENAATTSRTESMRKPEVVERSVSRIIGNLLGELSYRTFDVRMISLWNQLRDASPICSTLCYNSRHVSLVLDPPGCLSVGLLKKARSHSRLA